MGAGIKMAFEVIFGLVMFAGILWLSYFATKKLAKRFSLNGKGGQNLKVIETLSTGRESRLLLVKAGEKVLLVGATPSNMTLISEISAESIKDAENSVAETMDFSEALKINIEKIMKKKKNIREDNKNDKQQDSEKESS